MTNSDWYVQLDDIVIGPVTPDSLRTLIRDGLDTETAKIRLGQNGEWLPVSSISLAVGDPVLPPIQNTPTATNDITNTDVAKRKMGIELGTSRSTKQRQAKRFPSNSKTTSPLRWTLTRIAGVALFVVLFFGSGYLLNVLIPHDPVHQSEQQKTVQERIQQQSTQENSFSARPATKTGRHPRTGEMAKLRSSANDFVCYAISQKSLDRLNEYRRAQDVIGIQQMIDSGLAKVVPNDTECRVIHMGVFNYEVRIMSGANFGDIAFIETELVVPE